MRQVLGGQQQVLRQLSAKMDRGLEAWKWHDTLSPVVMAHVLFDPPMLWYILFAISHPPFVVNRGVFIALIALMWTTHYFAACTKPASVGPRPSATQLDAAFRAAGLERGSTSAPPLTKFVAQIGARLPVRYHWCKVCNVAVLKRDHHCPWVWNCVGVGNSLYFHIFISTVVFSCALLSHASAVWLLAHAPTMLPTWIYGRTGRLFGDRLLRVLLRLHSPLLSASDAAVAAGWQLPLGGDLSAAAAAAAAAPLSAAPGLMLTAIYCTWFTTSTVFGGAFAVASLFSVLTWAEGYTAVEKFYMARETKRFEELHAALGGGARAAPRGVLDPLSDKGVEKAIAAAATLAERAARARRDAERGGASGTCEREAREMSRAAGRTAAETTSGLCRAVEAERFAVAGGVGIAGRAVHRVKNIGVYFGLLSRKEPAASRYEE